MLRTTLSTALLLAAGLAIASGTASACGDKSLDGSNVGYYSFDQSIAAWRISHWFVDNAMANAPQRTDEIVVGSLPGGGGCGGVNCQPNSVLPDEQHSGRSLAVRDVGGYDITRPGPDAASATGACKLPEIVVTAEAPSSGGSRMIRRISGVHGRIYARRPPADAPNNPYNTNPATCGSDASTRLYHAAMDFAMWRMQAGLGTQLLGRGETARIHFDSHGPNGLHGTETYEWISGRVLSTSAPETWLRAMPNTLNCPQ